MCAVIGWAEVKPLWRLGLYWDVDEVVDTLEGIVQ
jgi:hypothetical protein